MSAAHQAYLDALSALADAQRAAQSAAYHKAPRIYLGLRNGSIDELCKAWRRALAPDARLEVAHGLWQTNIYEARLAAAKLLTQARIRPDDGAWRLIRGWVPDFDSWAIADHACMAGQKRLVAQPARLDEVEPWTQSEHLWTRRAALVITLPWARAPHPTQAERAARDRILGWAASYVTDPAWFIQKAIAWWLRDLSKRDPDRARRFLEAHGGAMRPFARKEASKYLPPTATPLP